jgi:tetratricopeptide (TPR) repeat protein
MASTGGAVSAVGAGLSALALRRAPDQQREIAERMAEALDSHLGRARHTEALQRQLVLILDGFTVGPQDIARGDVNAEKIAGLMRARVMAEAITPEHREDAVLDAYEAMLHATLLPLCTPHTQTQANNQEMLGRLTELKQLVKSQNADQPLRDAGIREAVILDLARKASGSTDNLAQAWTDLTAFFEAALQVQEQAPATNHDDFVDEVIARTRDLAKQGDYGSALEALEEALARDAEEQAAQQAAFEARTARLKQRQQNLLVLSAPEEAAAFLIAQADRTAGGSADVPDLRALQGEYYVRGRDKGIAADLLIAIELSKATLPRAGTPDARGAVLNNLGNALSILGERDSGTARLEEAVQAYRDALLEFTRERVPRDWAMTQNNLGNALQTLGNRESGTARLEEAVQAYRDALLERTRERVPLDWAMTQNNLGNALRNLGQRDSGTARLEEAVRAYHDAMLEWTRERVPLDWAITQFNISLVEIAFFDKTGDVAHLDAATEYLALAREVFGEAGATQYLATADQQEADITARRA